MHPFAMETAAILVQDFHCCTKMAAVAVVKLLLCCDITMQTLYNERRIM